MRFRSYSVALRRRHDKGKPDASPGRKATGPSRAAELPNVEVTRPTSGPSSEERRGASVPPRTEGLLVGLGTLRSSTCPPARDRPSCRSRGGLSSPEVASDALAREPRIPPMSKSTKKPAERAASRETRRQRTPLRACSAPGRNHERTRVRRLAGVSRAVACGVGEHRCRWKEERSPHRFGESGRGIHSQGVVRTVRDGDPSSTVAPRSGASGLWTDRKGVGPGFAL